MNSQEDAEKALLSSSSINGTACNLLQALSFLVAALHEKKDPDSFSNKNYIDALSHVW